MSCHQSVSEDNPGGRTAGHSFLPLLASLLFPVNVTTADREQLCPISE